MLAVRSLWSAGAPELAFVDLARRAAAGYEAEPELLLDFLVQQDGLGVELTQRMLDAWQAVLLRALVELLGEEDVAARLASALCSQDRSQYVGPALEHFVSTHASTFSDCATVQQAIDWIPLAPHVGGRPEESSDFVGRWMQLHSIRYEGHPLGVAPVLPLIGLRASAGDSDSRATLLGQFQRLPIQQLLYSAAYRGRKGSPTQLRQWFLLDWEPFFRAASVGLLEFLARELVATSTSVPDLAVKLEAILRGAADIRTESPRSLLTLVRQVPASVYELLAAAIHAVELVEPLCGRDIREPWPTLNGATKPSEVEPSLAAMSLPGRLATCWRFVVAASGLEAPDEPWAAYIEAELLQLIGEQSKAGTRSRHFTDFSVDRLQCLVATWPASEPSLRLQAVRMALLLVSDPWRSGIAPDRTDEIGSLLRRLAAPEHAAYRATCVELLIGALSLEDLGITPSTLELAPWLVPGTEARLLEILSLVLTKAGEHLPDYVPAAAVLIRDHPHAEVRVAAVPIVMQGVDQFASITVLVQSAAEQGDRFVLWAVFASLPSRTPGLSGVSATSLGDLYAAVFEARVDESTLIDIAQSAGQGADRWPPQFRTEFADRLRRVDLSSPAVSAALTASIDKIDPK